MEKFEFMHQGTVNHSYTDGQFILFVERIKNDVNGNPRYKVSPSMTCPVIMRRLLMDCPQFTRRYRSGRGYAHLQSYNIDASIEEVMASWKNIYYTTTGAPH